MILCCGEALIDMIPSADGIAFVPHPGGSVFNTAIGLGRQAIETGFLSGVSNDLFGQQLYDALRESKVTTSHLVRSNRPTTLAFVKLENGKANYSFYDENTAGRMLSKSDIPKDLPKNVDALFFGGISLAVEPCANAYIHLLERQADDHLIMVDPNIRPSFIADENRYRQRLTHVFNHADIVKISHEDLDWIVQSNESPESKIETVLGQGPRLVCLTLDADGAKIYGKNGIIASASTPIAKVVDTVGAGDAFNAGFLTMLDRTGHLSKAKLDGIHSDELANILNFATAFASDTVTRQGSDPAWNFGTFS